MADTGPSEGAYAGTNFVSVYSLSEKQCIGTLDHTDNILDFRLNKDGKILTTLTARGAFMWHIPSSSQVKQFLSAYRISFENGETKVHMHRTRGFTSTWSIPQDVHSWLEKVEGN